MVMNHDPLCYLYREDGEYNLMADRCSNCKLIVKVRADEGPKAVTRWIEQGAGSDDWMKVWQVRDYAEELEAKVRADERRRAVERVRIKKGKFPSTRLDWGTIADAILDGTKLRLSKKELNE